MIEIKITKNEEGYRLKKVCMNYLKEAPASFIYKMLRKKNIVLNDKKADGNEVLKIGDNIKFYLSDETLNKFSGRKIVSGINKTEADNETKKKIYTKTNKNSSENTNRSNNINSNSNTNKSILNKLINEIVYEDEDFLFLNKPKGILSQKAAPEDYSVNEAIIDYLTDSGAFKDNSLELFRPSVCNRLDRNTSGIILCSKSPKGARYLSEVIRNRTVEKYYLTVVSGKARFSGIYKAYLIKDKNKNQVEITDIPKEGAEKIETGAEFLFYNDKLNISLLRIHLITGKSHQIRAHLSHLGYPVIGDTKYGNPKINSLFNKNYKIISQMLSACEVVFPEGEYSVSGRSFKVKASPEFYKFFGEI